MLSSSTVHFNSLVVYISFSLSNCLFSYQLLNSRALTAFDFHRLLQTPTRFAPGLAHSSLPQCMIIFFCCKYFSSCLSRCNACWSNAHSFLFCVKDVSDAQWRNLRGNIPVLTLVFAIFTLLANFTRAFFNLRVKGMSIVWLLFSSAYLSYLHGAWYGTHALFILTFFFLSLLLFLTFISLV